jgi:hypothetical protein
VVQEALSRQKWRIGLNCCTSGTWQPKSWTEVDLVCRLWVEFHERCNKSLGFQGFIDLQIYYYFLKKKSVPRRWLHTKTQPSLWGSFSVYWLSLID